MKRILVPILFFALVFPMTCFSAQYFYYLPYFQEKNNVGPGVALRNCSGSSTAYIAVEAYSADGARQGLDPAVAIPSSIPPRGQKAFPVKTSRTNASGWIRVSSNQPLVGLCFVSEDNFMMDVTMFSELYKSLYVPHGAQSDHWDTTVHVCNPNNAANAIKIVFVDADGNAVDSRNYSLPPMGGGSYNLGDFLTGDHSDGSIEVSASLGIAAFAQYDNLKTTTGKCYAGISALSPAGGSGDDQAGETFDGRWTGTAVSATSTDHYGDPCANASLDFTVSGANISGTARDSFGQTYNINGSIDSQGNINAGIFMGYATGGSFTGKAAGSSASCDWEEYYGCRGTWTLKKQ